MVDGILDGDGSSKGGVYKLTSISLKLVNSLNLAIMKLYGVVGSIAFTERPKTTIIDGRTVNQRNTYTVQFSKERRKQVNFSEIEGYFVAPVSSVVKTDTIKPVYNIEVDGDNSYTVNNCIVHNCQAWSVAGKQLGDKDERGMLFWTTLEIIAHVLKHNPSAKFLMENVKMKKDFEQYITHHTEQALGKVEKTLINSALVSAQNRQRYYWTNFEVSQPDDKGILLKDIIDDNVGGFISSDESNYTERWKKQIKKNSKTKEQKAVALCTNANVTGSGVNVLAVHGGAMRGRYIVDGKRQDHKMKTAGLTEQRLEVRNDGKTNALTTVQKDSVVVFKDKSQTLLATIYKENAKSMVKRNKFGLCVSDINKTEYVEKGIHYRKLTPLECERLQTLPDNWTSMLSNTQRYKSIGNGWTIDVIAHIFSGLN